MVGATSGETSGRIAAASPGSCAAPGLASRSVACRDRGSLKSREQTTES